MDLKTAIYRYCSYQERCHSEVQNKLYELGGVTPEIEGLIAELIETDVLNEERFARAYARGKFRMKQWGKSKIVSGLRMHKVSEYCIKKGLLEIGDDEYEEVLEKEAEKAMHRYRAQKPAWKQRSVVFKYLLSHGWESRLIQKELSKKEGGSA